jgi:hypothetical protein
MADDTATASVLAIRLVDYATRPVADQAALRERLEALIRHALSGIPDADRIVLDTDDGGLVVLLGGPLQALAVADAARAGAASDGLAIALGLNAGPVKQVAESGRDNLIGDGIAAALATAGFAGGGELLASRAFRDAAGAPSAARFLAAGSRTDQSLRLHELFACTPPPDARRASRRRALRIAGVAGVALLGAGIATRVTREVVAARGRPARVALEITPWAEVIVDGKDRGRTPPLKTLDLPPGRRTIVLRHGPAQPLVLELDLKPGEQTTVRHAFGPAPSRAQQPNALRSFLRGLGL